MTAALYRSSTPSLAVPHTQNTAPVLEFNCLYTHDIRRKQKRWQDGFARFHTFNKRVMVYDIPRNLIGGTHWKEGSELQDGDEVRLESEGVIVQIAEMVGTTETDLTELRRSRKKGSSEIASSSPVRTAHAPIVPVSNGRTPKPTTRLKHRSLNALLGISNGPIGKASLPTNSPFEERYFEAESGEWSNGRAAKRMRLHELSHRSVTRTTTNTSRSLPKEELQLWARTSDSKKQKKPPLEVGQQKLDTKEVIDLSIDMDEQERFLPGFSSDALAPCSSPQKGALPATKSAPVRSSSPAFQRQSTPVDPPDRLSARNPKRTDRLDAQGRREDIRRTAVDVHVDDKPRQPQNCAKQSPDPLNPRQMQQRAIRTDAASEVAQPMQSTSSKSGKTLRMTASAPKKKTLLCQAQVLKKSSRAHSANTEKAIEALLEVTSQDSVPTKAQPKSQRRQLQERLARIGRKTTSERGNVIDVREDAIESPHADLHLLNINDARPKTPLNDTTLELAKLDQMIMPPERPPSPKAPAIPKPQERQFRRVVSESNDLPFVQAKRPPGAPVRYKQSPIKKSPTPLTDKETSFQTDATKKAPVPLPISRTKKPIQRSVSLNATSNGTSTVILSGPFQAPKSPTLKPTAAEKAPDAWSREAFDLFAWRPPGWDEDKWCFKEKSDGTVVAA